MIDKFDKLIVKAKSIKEKFKYEEVIPEGIKTEDIAKTIEHTNLKSTATPEDIKLLCQEAVENKFRSVCIHPSYIPVAKEYLSESDVIIVTVIGFPLGMNTTVNKAKEVENAISLGADEVDMVINQGRLKAGNYQNVFFDISKVVKAAGSSPVKVIIEACNLTDEEKIIACLLSEEAGAKYVKTSTGFAQHGATLEDVALMRYTVGPDVLVKAAGGVRDLEMARKMIATGAALLGTSSGIKILNGDAVNGGY
ncbi:MAG TPA: deoxyribose-phosphate aldolase [Thermotogota bacterium]|nr:deoxyribose-phosphate aldolase [Thermotogota bacterium]HPR94864.1 deoxyribose-phosphate aldolase [Thermotogota bacterium]